MSAINLIQISYGTGIKNLFPSDGAFPTFWEGCKKQGRRIPYLVRVRWIRISAKDDLRKAVGKNGGQATEALYQSKHTIEQSKMSTCYFTPKNRPLSDAVKSFWQVKRQNLFKNEVIVPKGIVEIIFNFSTEVKLQAQLYDAEFLIPRCFVQGYHTRPIHLTLPANHCLFGVVINTAATKQILDFPPGELFRQCVDLTLIDPSIDSLWYQLAEKASFQERCMLLSNWMLKRLSCVSARDRAFNSLFTLNTSRKLTVAHISDWLCYSPRQLSRKFYQLTGMNTELTLLYLKYVKAKGLIHTSDLSLSQIAYLSDFSDQSHFVKTFKRYTALTPGDYRRKKSALEGHYFENVR